MLYEYNRFVLYWYESRLEYQRVKTSLLFKVCASRARTALGTSVPYMLRSAPVPPVEVSRPRRRETMTLVCGALVASGAGSDDWAEGLWEPSLRPPTRAGGGPGGRRARRRGAQGGLVCTRAPARNECTGQTRR